MKHWRVLEAKARFSELLRAAEKKPQIITYRGQPRFEVRAVAARTTKKGPKTLLELLRSAPPGFGDLELPPRK
jgi:prevent-host-death family protein